MTQAVPNPDKIRAERVELQRLRDPRERLENETSDPETRAVLDEWAAETGSPEALSLDDIRAGKYSPESLSHRMDEVNRLLDPSHKADSDITAADIRSMSAEQVAEFGADRALAIINAEGQR